MNAQRSRPWRESEWPADPDVAAAAAIAAPATRDRAVRRLASRKREQQRERQQRQCAAEAGSEAGHGLSLAPVDVLRRGAGPRDQREEFFLRAWRRQLVKDRKRSSRPTQVACQRWARQNRPFRARMPDRTAKPAASPFPDRQIFTVRAAAPCPFAARRSADRRAARSLRACLRRRSPFCDKA